MIEWLHSAALAFSVRSVFLALQLFPVIAMANAAGSTTIQSDFNVATTLDRLSRLATSKGLTVFARIDFARDAHAAGLILRDEQLLIFGNPKAGTPLLQAAPSIGIDLPLKALAYEDAEGITWVVFNDPAYLLNRHGAPAELEANIPGAAALMRAAASALTPPAGKAP